MCVIKKVYGGLSNTTAIYYRASVMCDPYIKNSRYIKLLSL